MWNPNFGRARWVKIWQMPNRKKETQEALELRKGKAHSMLPSFRQIKRFEMRNVALQKKKKRKEKLSAAATWGQTEGQVAIDGFSNDTYLTSRILLLNWSSLTVAFPRWRVPIPLGPLVLVQKKERKTRFIHSNLMIKTFHTFSTWLLELIYGIFYMKRQIFIDPKKMNINIWILFFFGSYHLAILHLSACSLINFHPCSLPGFPTGGARRPVIWLSWLVWSNTCPLSGEGESLSACRSSQQRLYHCL